MATPVPLIWPVLGLMVQAGRQTLGIRRLALRLPASSLALMVQETALTLGAGLRAGVASAPRGLLMVAPGV